MISALVGLIRPPVGPDGHPAHRFKVQRRSYPTLFYIECGCGGFTTALSLHKQTAVVHWRDHAREALDARAA